MPAPRARRPPRWPRCASSRAARADLLAEVYGVMPGFSEAGLDEPLTRQAAELCRFSSHPGSLRTGFNVHSGSSAGTLPLLQAPADPGSRPRSTGGSWAGAAPRTRPRPAPAAVTGMRRPPGVTDPASVPCRYPARSGLCLPPGPSRRGHGATATGNSGLTPAGLPPVVVPVSCASVQQSGQAGGCSWRGPYRHPGCGDEPRRSRADNEFHECNLTAAGGRDVLACCPGQARRQAQQAE